MEIETKKTEEVKTEATTSDSNAGSKYETTPIIERAREEREKMEKATAAQKVENDRSEAIAAKRELGGTIKAGQTEEKKEETPLEYKNRIMGVQNG